MQVQLLLDAASKLCGGDTKLAIRMGVSQSVVSDLRHGKRTITPETAAELADIAGVDPFQAIADAMIERSKGTRREAILKEILGKGIAAGVAAMLAFSYSGDSISGTSHKNNVIYSPTKISEHLTACKSYLVRMIKRLVHGGGRRLRRTTGAVGKSIGTGARSLPWGLPPHTPAPA